MSKRAKQPEVAELDGMPISGPRSSRGEYVYKVPLRTLENIERTAKSPITNKTKFQIALRNGLVGWSLKIYDQLELVNNHKRIYNDLKQTIIDVIPRGLLADPEGNAICRNVYNLRYEDGSSDINVLRYLYDYIKIKFDELDKDGEATRKQTAGIDEAGIKLTPEQEAAKELRTKADKKMAEQKRNEEFAKEMKDDHNSGGL